MNHAPKSYAVIGAGISGLTVSYALKKRGFHVNLFEAAPRAGGAIHSHHTDQWLIETGPNTILATAPEIGKLIDQLGLNAEKYATKPVAKKRYIVRNGKPVALPSGPLSFWGNRAFSPAAKLRLIAEPLIRSKSTPEENLADFVVRRLGREFFDYAISPFVSGIYAGNPATLSVCAAFPKLYALEQEYGSLIVGALFGARKRKNRQETSKKDARMFSFDMGLEVLTNKLADSLSDTLHLNTPVHDITPLPTHQWKLAEKTYDGVILALPAQAITRLKSPFETDFLKDIYYPSVASLALGFKREQIAHPLDGFGMLIPPCENRFSLGTLFSSSLFDGRAPAGSVLLTSFIGGAHHPERAQLPENELIEKVLEDHRSLLGLSGDPTFVQLSRHDLAIPQYHVGYEKIQQHLQWLETQTPGLHFCGHIRDGISVADCIRSGLRCANEIAEKVQRHG